MNRKILAMTSAVLFFAQALCSCVERTILSENTPAPSGSARPKKARCAIWFVKVNNQGNELVSVERIAPESHEMEYVVQELLSGPKQEESVNGLGSEIPLGTILLGIKEESADIELNLSKRFAASGGATSFQTRLDQLIRTVSPVADGKNVYLDIEGQRLTTTQGDGLEVKQPINK